MRITIAFVKKEFLQIIKDPSSLVIAFVIPLILLFIYMYGINMDMAKVKLGIKNDDSDAAVQTLVKSFGHSQYVQSAVYLDQDKMHEDMVRSKIKGALIIPDDFSQRLAKGQTAQLFVIADGAEINQAGFVQSYAGAVANNWLATSKFKEHLMPQLMDVQTRYWFNQDLDSHLFIVPGSLAVTMTLIGILLTALVIAREWERGTMEALLSTNIKPVHLVLGKYIPYFTVGMSSLIFSVFMMVVVFNIPFRGNYFILLFVSGLFLFTCLGVGLIISTSLKNQFLASMASLIAGFLPALMLSGLIFPINSMPAGFQYLTMILPPRYFVSFIKSEFLVGTIPSIVIVNSLFLLLLGSLLFALVYKKTARRLSA
jgi:ABC-2 type transport system permease protein